LDADDFWSKNKLEIVNRYVLEPGFELLGHSYADCNAKMGELSSSYKTRWLDKRRLLLRNPAQTSCVVMRARSVRRFNAAMHYCEDYDLWLRIAETTNVLWLVGPPLTELGRPQLSPGGQSSSAARMRLGEIRVYYAFCSRSWIRRAWLLPILLLYSAFKHAYSIGRRKMGLRSIAGAMDR